jgi:hypothetical protein
MDDLVELARQSLQRRCVARPICSKPLAGEVLMIGDDDGWAVIQRPNGNIVWVNREMW